MWGLLTTESARSGEVLQNIFLYLTKFLYFRNTIMHSRAIYLVTPEGLYLNFK